MSIIGIESYLDEFGEKGNTERLELVSNLVLGVRSEAAKRVVSRRFNKFLWLHSRSENLFPYITKPTERKIVFQQSWNKQKCR